MVSIITPVAGDSKDWLSVVAEQSRCLSYQTYTDFEYIIVESYKDRVQFGGVGCNKHIPIKMEDKGFRLGWMWNVGARHADGDLLILTGADYVFGKDYLKELIEFFENSGRDFIRIGIDVFQLDAISTLAVMKSNFYTAAWPPNGLTGKNFHNMGSGNILCKKEFYWKVGGYSENFYNRGWEDQEFLFRAQHISNEPKSTSCTNFNYKLLHLNHPRGTNGNIGVGNFEFATYVNQHTEESVRAHTKQLLGNIEGPIEVNLKQGKD